MSYQVVIVPSAEKAIRKLHPAMIRRVDRTIDKLKTNPRQAGSIKLQGSKEGWRIRVGDWRIVYDIDDAAKKVFISRVRHRSEAYKKK